MKYPLPLYSARHEGLIVFSDRRACLLHPDTLFKAYMPDFGGGGAVEVAWFRQGVLLVNSMKQTSLPLTQDPKRRKGDPTTVMTSIQVSHTGKAIVIGRHPMPPTTCYNKTD